MYEIEKDTYVSEKILYNEYSYRYGTKKTELVEFITTLLLIDNHSV